MTARSKIKSFELPECHYAARPLLEEPVARRPISMALVGDVSQEKHPAQQKLYLSVEDVPRFPTLILTAFQQIIVCASGVVAMPLVIADTVCAQFLPLAKVKLLGTMLFVTGLSTILQTALGTRLPLLQGPSFAFLPPVLAFMALPQFRCSDIQGGLVTASVVEILIGLTGLIGLITRYVGPLTIAPLMLLLEFSVVGVVVNYVSMHWISAVTALLLVIVALYLSAIKVPLPVFQRGKPIGVTRYPLFAIFPYLIAISTVWILCAILTLTDVFDQTNHAFARTDQRSGVIAEAPWFRWPYPGQWGSFRFNIGVMLGMIAGTVASIIESVGDYHACARACDLPPPPSHAVNRGILLEGLACLIGGSMGAAVGVTTYSENVGAIGITKVASRRTLQAAGLIFIFLGIFTKFGAVLVTIPDPLVGGILMVSLAMVAGVGLSSVHTVDLTLTRNTGVMGLALMVGIVVPAYVQKYPVKSGNETIDQLLTVLLSINMLVGGVAGFVLDNTVPGATREQRGLKSIESQTISEKKRRDLASYSFPEKFIATMSKFRFYRFIPFMPQPDGV